MLFRKVLTAVLVSLVAAAAQAQERKLTFTLDFIALGRHAAWYVPITKGYYKAEGLNVSISPGTNSIEPIARVASGEYDFGFGDIVVKLSTRPEKRVGTDEMWDHAEVVMTRVLKQIEEQSGGRIKTAINPGEGAFYGPKFEYVLRDAIGRDWQCGTIQVDFNLPERFGAFYIDADGEKKTPVMIH